MKALNSVRKDDDTQWLIYWVVFSWFSVIEFFSDIVCGWIPFYWLFKVKIESKFREIVTFTTNVRKLDTLYYFFINLRVEI